MSGDNRVCGTCGRLFAAGPEGQHCPACLLAAGLDDDPEEASLPDTFQHYEILKRADGTLFELGRGAMGVTYKALDRNLGSHVALKVIQSSYLENTEVRARFFQEARAAARLQHPNVASVFHLDSEGKNAFYVMEFVAGETLEAFVRRHGRLSAELALEIAQQITRALAAADKQQLIHRDIKPSNIMLIQDEHGDCIVKVIDFGLAKLRASTGQHTGGRFIGTPQFASPEQFGGEEVDIRADIYALGVTLWYMLTGSVPLAGGLTAIGQQHQQKEALPFEQLRSFPKAVQQLLGKMLHRDPQERPRTPALLQQALKNCREALPANPDQSRSRRRIFWISLSLALAVLAAATIYVATLPRLDSAGPPSLVVLPFKNLSPGVQDAWFGEALTEQITTNLAQIGDLKVVSRSSAETLAKSGKSTREIGRELGVRAVLEGSATRDGSKLRVSTRLIDARTDQILTAAVYDREMKDIFDLQADLARNISAALHATLNSREQARLDRRPTANITAYDLYLRGRDYYNRYNFEDNERAIQFFSKAKDSDASFALAYAGLADAYAQKVTRFAGEKRWLEASLTASQKALQLDPNLAEAYKAIGLVYFVQGEISKSMEASSRAVDLNPNMVSAIVNRALGYREKGRLAEALAGLLEALKIDPLDVPLRTNLGDLYVTLGLPADATRAYQSAIDLQPERSDAALSLCRLHLVGGETELARRDLARLLQNHPNDPFVLNLQAQVAFFTRDFVTARQLYSRLLATNRAGDIFFFGTIRYLTALAAIDLQNGSSAEAESFLEEADALDRQSMRESGENSSPIYDLAAVEALRGDKAKALALLDQAAQAGWTELASLRLDPRFDALRSEDGFAKFLTRQEDQIAQLRKKVLDASRDALSH